MFRLNAKSIFLTYPKCSLSKEELLEHLQGLKYPGSATIDKYCISIEKHKDDTYHLHALIQLSKKVDLRSSTFFDTNLYHPNVQGARSANHILQYIKKDGDFISTFNSSTKLTYTDLIDSSSSKEEFFQLVRREFPRDYVLNHEKIEYFANKHYKTMVSNRGPVFTEFSNVPSELTDWFSANCVVGKTF